MVRSHRSITLLLLTLIALVTACSSEDAPVCDSSTGKVCVLFDQYHARKQNWTDYRLDKDAWAYQGTYANARMVDHLKRNNWEPHKIREQRLTKEILSSFQVLFINLVDETRPDFTQEEVDAIVDFVGKGGGLFLIADHTNVYSHAERVNKFLEPMGLKVLYHTIVDSYPEYSVAGTAWVKSKDVKPHFVTQDVEEICIQTGGPIVATDGDKSVELVHSSKQSFGDFWDKSTGGGYYGDWTYHEGTNDIKGPLNMVAVREYKEGRIFVLSDQNIIGDPWLYYVDNFALTMNGFDWVAKRDDDTTTRLRNEPIEGIEIAFEQAHTAYQGGGSLGNYFFEYYFNSNRVAEATTKGAIRLGDEDVYHITPVKKAFTSDEISAIKSKLEGGTTVVVHLPVNDLTTGSIALLQGLDPSVTLSVANKDYTLDQLKAVVGTIPQRRVDGRFKIKSGDPLLKLKDLEVSDWSENPNEFAIYDDVQQNDPDKKGALGQENERSTPFLFEVTSTWADPFITTEDDAITIARRKKIGSGELIVFFQDGLLRHNALGNYLQKPNEFNLPQLELNYSLIDYFIAKHKK